MRKFIPFALCLTEFCLIGQAHATIISFNDTVTTAQESIGMGQNASYVESGFTLSTHSGAVLYLKDGDAWGGGYADDGSDWAFFEGYGVGGSLTGPAPFSLQQLDLSTVFRANGGTVVFTGNLAGGGTVGLTANTGTNATWSTVSFDSSWTDLLSVNIDGSASVHVALDNIIVNQPVATTVPEPGSLALLLAAGLSLLAMRNNRHHRAI